jgi:glycogen(starch) synthase
MGKNCKLNLLVVTGEYPPDTGYGGIGTYSKHMAESMAAIGCRVTVIARSTSSVESISVVNGVTICRIALLPHPLPSFRLAYPLRQFAARYFPHSLNRLSWSLAVTKKITLMLKTMPRFDVIEAPECGAEGLFIFRSMCRCRVIRMHTPWEMIRELDLLKEPWGDRLMLPWLEKITARKAEGRTAPSQAMASEIARRWHIHSTVIRNPLPAAMYSRTTGTGWTYTGRIERRKGVHHLIRAYADINKNHPVPHLTLIGSAYGTDPDGRNYGSVIRSMIDELNIGTSVTWLNHAALEEVAGVLRNTAVAFFPSLWENFPYACLEAMASGCIVVAGRCGGFPEIITHEKNGLLVEPDSPRSLTTVMEYIIGHPECRRSLGQAARDYIEHTLAPDCIAREMEQFYRHLLEQ